MAETDREADGRAAKGDHSSLTEYVILEWRSENEGWSGWISDGPVKARSAEDAIRKYGQEGTFVAIPARSWKPVTVEAKQTVTLDLKPAT